MEYLLVDKAGNTIVIKLDEYYLKEFHQKYIDISKVKRHKGKRELYEEINHFRDEKQESIVERVDK